MDPRTRQAFALWTAAQPAVSAFVHALAGDRALRDEVLQDTATRVLESFGHYDTTRPFLPWALTIARRALSDARRRQRRFPVALSPAAEEALAAAMSPAADAVRAQVDHLNHCIDLLRDQQRELCDLRYRADLRMFEDVDLARRLWAHGSLRFLRPPVVVSARRYEARPLRSLLAMNLFPAAWRLGVPTAVLERLYGAPR